MTALLILVWCAGAQCDERRYEIEGGLMACSIAAQQIAARDSRPGWRVAKARCRA